MTENLFEYLFYIACNVCPVVHVTSCLIVTYYDKYLDVLPD